MTTDLSNILSPIIALLLGASGYEAVRRRATYPSLRESEQPRTTTTATAVPRLPSYTSPKDFTTTFWRLFILYGPGFLPTAIEALKKYIMTRDMSALLMLGNPWPHLNQMIVQGQMLGVVALIGWFLTFMQVFYVSFLGWMDVSKEKKYVIAALLSFITLIAVGFTVLFVVVPFILGGGALYVLGKWWKKIKEALNKLSGAGYYVDLGW